MVTIHDRLRPLMVRFRRERMARLAQALDLTPDTRVLDVGGTPSLWELSPVRPCITFVNIYSSAPAGLKPHDEYCSGDGRALPFEDRSFDAVVSNSVIEHVGTREDQAQFAREIRRVGVRYFVQTPDLMFPIEPHFLAPLVQAVPRKFRARVVRYGTPFGWFNRRRPEYVRQMADEVRLLSVANMHQFFPDAVVVRERTLGLSKSLLAIR